MPHAHKNVRAKALSTSHNINNVYIYSAHNATMNSSIRYLIER